MYPKNEMRKRGVFEQATLHSDGPSGKRQLPASSGRGPAANGTERNAKEPLLPWWTLLMLFLYRLFLAFTMPTAESPDEWWQSAEVAYYMVFGKGHLTWEWKEGIRSVVFPSVYALPFLILKLTHLDNAYTVYGAERLVQVCIAVSIDVTMIALSRVIDRAVWKDAADDAAAAGRDKEEDSDVVVVETLNGDRGPTDEAQKRHGWFTSSSVAKTTVHVAMIHWYLAYNGARAYSNVAEGLFVMLALLADSYPTFLFIAGVACMVRVTAVLALFPVFLYRASRELRRRGTVRGLCYCLVTGVALAGIVLGIMMAIDYTFYRRWILTPYRFLEFNVIKNVSQFYGVYPWWWFFAVGFPVMVGPHLLFLLLLPLVLWRLSAVGSGARRTRAVVRRLLGVMLWTLSMHSTIAHKEVRFMFPMLPVALVLVSFVLSTFVRLPHQMRLLTVGRRSTKAKRVSLVNPVSVRVLHVLFVVVNVFLILGLGYLYRLGGVSVMAAVRHAPVESFDRVDVLTHCYFTPGYSHVHRKVRELRLIDCPMELDPATNRPRVTDDILFRQYPDEFVSWLYRRRLPSATSPQATRESAAFQTWLAEMQRRMPEGEAVELPDGIIVFSSVSDALAQDFFEGSGYRKLYHIFHAFKGFEEDEDNYVDFWVRDSSSMHVGSVVGDAPLS